MEIAVIGAGEWGRNHARVFGEMKPSPLRFVVDADEKRASELAKRYGVLHSTDYERILDKVSAVSICTPASTHYDIAKKCLLAGKHVFVEKPLCLNSKEADELCKLSRKTGNLLVVGYIFRFNPAVQQIKKEIDANTFGKLFFLYGSRMGLRTPRPDCGVIFDFAVHDMDVFCYLLCEEYPDEITAVGSTYFTNYEDVAFITLKFPNRLLANLHVNWLAPKKIRELWIIGEKKSAFLDYMTQKIEIYDSGLLPKYNSFGDFSLITKEGPVSVPHVEKTEPLKSELTHFLNCCDGKESPISGCEVGYRSIVAVEAAMASMRTGRIAKVVKN